jgi:nitroreductase
MDVIEAMETCRAMRYLKRDPVPDELVERVLYAATRASNPGNSQGWAFVVVRDEETKARIHDAVIESLGFELDESAAAQTGADPMAARVARGAFHLLRNLRFAPVIIIVGARCIYPPQNPMKAFLPSSIYPAAQNLIVAARALGLGTTFTTFCMQAEPQIREILGIPEDVHLGSLIPLGWPERRFGPVTRKPLGEVVHYDRWDPSR